MRDYSHHPGKATVRPERSRNPTMTDDRSISGAESLVHALVGSGVDHCFTNPGTSEMHFVAALDRIAGIRCVLALFEGVATGAAARYPPIPGTLAPTLLPCYPITLTR